VIANNKSVKFSGGEDIRAVNYRYGDIFQSEMKPKVNRFIIGPNRGHIDLMLSLAKTWDGSFFILYILLTPDSERRKPGRYQCPYPLSEKDLRIFCDKFRGFLEGDGRHHFWIASIENRGMLIYDQHDIIYAYGNLEMYKSILLQADYTERPVNIPSPHTHHFWPENHEQGEALLEYFEWVYSPLHPYDE
jgi:hypothetical protein